MKKAIFLSLLLLLSLPSPGEAFMRGGGGGAATCRYPLPLASNTVAAAYSMRKLIASYAGKSINIIRASDSAASDIGFATNNCDFDTAAATSFCASTTCKVAKWYDQSGNSADAAQAASGNQPSFTLNANNSIPGISFTSTPSVFLTGTLASGVAADTYSMVGDRTSSAVSQFWATIGPTTSNFTGIQWSSSTTACAARRTVGGTNSLGTKTCAISTFLSVMSTQNNTLSRVFVSNSAGTDSATSLTIPTSTAITVGAGPDHLNNVTGVLQELIVFAPDISTGNAGTLYTNQATYWAVP